MGDGGQTYVCTTREEGTPAPRRCIRTSDPLYPFGPLQPLAQCNLSYAPLERGSVNFTPGGKPRAMG
jgi:hypothetical protein